MTVTNSECMEIAEEAYNKGYSAARQKDYVMEWEGNDWVRERVFVELEEEQ